MIKATGLRHSYGARAILRGEILRRARENFSRSWEKAAVEKVRSSTCWQEIYVPMRDA